MSTSTALISDSLKVRPALQNISDVRKSINSQFRRSVTLNMLAQITIKNVERTYNYQNDLFDYGRTRRVEDLRDISLGRIDKK